MGRPDATNSKSDDGQGSALADFLNWRSLAHSDLEREYSPSSCVAGGIDDLISQYESRSEAARQWCIDAGLPIVEIAYGPLASQTLDLVTPPAADDPVPLVVFIHGGYWQQLSKKESFFNAPDCLEQGIAFASIDYTLAPHADLGQIIDECRSAVAAVLDSAPVHGIDVDRIMVAGSSAGAHLAAMVGLGLDTGWRPASLTLLSGVFDLEPLVSTYVNEAVGLTTESAHLHSPAQADLAKFPPTLIAYGDNETDQFKKQSEGFATLLRQHERSVTTHEVADRNHFDIVFDLCDSNHELGMASIALLTTEPTQRTS